MEEKADLSNNNLLISLPLGNLELKNQKKNVATNSLNGIRLTATLENEDCEPRLQETENEKMDDSVTVIASAKVLRELPPLVDCAVSFDGLGEEKDAGKVTSRDSPFVVAEGVAIEGVATEGTVNIGEQEHTQLKERENCRPKLSSTRGKTVAILEANVFEAASDIIAIKSDTRKGTQQTVSGKRGQKGFVSVRRRASTRHDIRETEDDITQLLTAPPNRRPSLPTSSAPQQLLPERTRASSASAGLRPTFLEVVTTKRRKGSNDSKSPSENSVSDALMDTSNECNTLLQAIEDGHPEEEEEGPLRSVGLDEVARDEIRSSSSGIAYPISHSPNADSPNAYSISVSNDISSVSEVDADPNAAFPDTVHQDVPIYPIGDDPLVTRPPVSDVPFNAMISPLISSLPESPISASAIQTPAFFLSPELRPKRVIEFAPGGPGGFQLVEKVATLSILESSKLSAAESTAESSDKIRMGSNERQLTALPFSRVAIARLLSNQRRERAAMRGRATGTLGQLSALGIRRTSSVCSEPSLNTRRRHRYEIILMQHFQNKFGRLKKGDVKVKESSQSSGIRNSFGVQLSRHLTSKPQDLVEASLNSHTFYGIDSHGISTHEIESHRENHFSPSRSSFPPMASSPPLGPQTNRSSTGRSVSAFNSVQSELLRRALEQHSSSALYLFQSDCILRAIMTQITPSEQERESKRVTFNALASFLSSWKGHRMKVFVAGSTAYDVDSTSSDLDIVITTNDNTNYLKVLQDVCEKIRLAKERCAVHPSIHWPLQ